MGLQNGPAARRTVLAVNCGSSTIKFRLVHAGSEPDGAGAVASGIVERIGRPGRMAFRRGADVVDQPLQVADHAQALKSILDWLDGSGELAGVEALAHRIVHGAGLEGPRLIDRQVEEILAEATHLAPLHNPPALAAVRAARARLGRDVPMTASFDTTFHDTLPEYAWRYALPVELADAHGIRRYGFHGLAHRWMSLRAADLMGRSLHATRLITFQLGNGCSMAAIRDGRSIDTSMGATPLEGLVMGTRTGDLDPAVPDMIARREGLDADRIERLLNYESGLLGLSGVSNDVRELLEAEQAGNRRARLALEVFVYRAQKYGGAYMTALQGADALVFGGGIGENQPEIRARICSGLQWCGVIVDAELNRRGAGMEGKISPPDASPEVYVVPVDEMALLVRDALAVLENLQPGR